MMCLCWLGRDGAFVLDLHGPASDSLGPLGSPVCIRMVKGEGEAEAKKKKIEKKDVGPMEKS